MPSDYLDVEQFLLRLHPEIAQRRCLAFDAKKQPCPRKASQPHLVTHHFNRARGPLLPGGIWSDLALCLFCGHHKLQALRLAKRWEDDYSDLVEFETSQEREQEGTWEDAYYELKKKNAKLEDYVKDSREEWAKRIGEHTSAQAEKERAWRSQTKHDAAQIAELEAELSERLGKISILEERNKFITERQKEMEDECARASDRLDAKKRQLSEVKLESSNLHVQLQVTKDQLEICSSKVVHLESQLDKAKSQCAKLEGSTATMQDQIARLEQLNAALNKELQAADCKYTELEIDTKAKFVRIGEENGRLVEWQNEISMEKARSASTPEPEESSSLVAGWKERLRSRKWNNSISHAEFISRKLS